VCDPATFLGWSYICEFVIRFTWVGLVLPAKIGQAGKSSQGEKLTYLASSSLTNRNVLITLTLVVDVIKPFCFINDEEVK
jgi:hypothetical protein